VVSRIEDMKDPGCPSFFPSKKLQIH